MGDASASLWSKIADKLEEAQNEARALLIKAALRERTLKQRYDKQNELRQELEKAEKTIKELRLGLKQAEDEQQKLRQELEKAEKCIKELRLKLKQAEDEQQKLRQELEKANRPLC